MNRIWTKYVLNICHQYVSLCYFSTSQITLANTPYMTEFIICVGRRAGKRKFPWCMYVDDSKPYLYDDIWVVDSVAMKSFIEQEGCNIWFKAAPSTVAKIKSSPILPWTKVMYSISNSRSFRNWPQNVIARCAPIGAWTFFMSSNKMISWGLI